MALATATGTTLSRTTTGTTTVSGLGFKPNLILFWGTLRTSNGTGPTSGFGHMHWSIATRRNDDVEGWHCYGAWAADNVATSDTGGSSHDDGRAIAILSASAPVSLEASAQLDTWDTDGFTLNWDIVSSNQYIVNWYAIGGDSITQITGGLQGIQSADVNFNLTWQPDVVFFLIGSSFAQSIWSFGMASGSGADEQCVMYGINRDGVNPSESAQSFVPGAVGGYYRITTVIEKDLLFHVDEFNSTGFRITVSDTAAASRVFFWVALQGGQHTVGHDTVPVTATTQSIAVEDRPQGVFFCGGQQPNEDKADAGFSFGAMVPGASHTAAFASLDNASPTVVEQYQGDQALIGGLDISGADPTSLASEDGFTDYPGAFQLDWTEVSGAAERFMYWACGAIGFLPQIYRWWNVTDRR